MTYARARANMVDRQLRPNRVDDPRVLAAMGEVPRELFVPRHLRGVAYSDEDLDLGDGRRLIEPLVLARMVQAAEVRPQDSALVVGDDTGYCAAVLSRLASTVFLLAPDAARTEAIDRLLTEAGYDNVVVHIGEPRVGLPQLAPFDVILLAGSIVVEPRHLLEQLADGGRLVAVMMRGLAGRITVWKRVGEAIGATSPFDAAIPPLSALLPEPSFVF
ncbi:Protein-L-isoaspartate O-methyltransferase [bacterium HR40]|nr:Protein-L-isoaspartate O-methyltransferase [bacterium HR40]